MKVLEEFRQFAVRGNVIDLAVGVIIGAAFGRIVTSMVNDVIMPAVGKVTGGVDFKHLFINLDPGRLTKDGTPAQTLAEAKEAGAAVIAYGAFLNTLIDFMIVAACVFLLIKLVNHWRRTQPAAPAAPSPQEKLLTEIRDLLRSK
jgi:large conductance mechanosensitive channel